MKTQSMLAIMLCMLAFEGCKLATDEAPFTSTTTMKTIEKIFPLQGFDKIDMGTAFVVNIKEGLSFEVKAIGDSTDIQDLVYILKNNTLSFKYAFSRPHRESMQINISLPILRKADFYEASSGSIECSGKADNLDLSLRGASHFQVKGVINKINASVQEASYLNTYNTDNQETILNIDGASQARIAASQRLEITAKGVSKVWYKGAAATVIKVYDLSQAIKD